MKKHALILFFVLTAFCGQAQLLHERRYIPKIDYSDIVASAPDRQGNILYSGIHLIGNYKFQQTFLLVKPDADTLFTRKLSTPLGHEAITLKPMPGGFLFTGNTWLSSSNSAGSLQRRNALAAPTMVKDYIGLMGGIISALVLPGKDFIWGGVYGTGAKFSFARTDSLGNVKWAKDYKWSNNSESVIDLAHTKDGNIIALGVSRYPVNAYHPKLMLINQNGDSLAGRQLILTGFNRGERLDYNQHSILTLSDGSFLFTADTDTTSSFYPNGGGSSLGIVVKVDSGLNIVWKYVYRTPTVADIRFSKSRELADGSVLVLGSMPRSFTAPTNKFALYRFDIAGQLINTYPFTSNICTDALMATTLDVLNDSTFMVGGRCGDGSTLAMYVATVKIPGLPPVLPIIQPGTITSTKPELALQTTGLGQSYPNPAQDEALIPYNLPNGTKLAAILLKDITGREAGSYILKVNQKQGSLPVNLSNFRNGLYLYSLVVDGKPVATRKLAVAR